MAKVVDLNFLHPPAAIAAVGTYAIMPGCNGVGDTNCIRSGNGQGRTGSDLVTTGRLQYPADASLRGATRTTKLVRVQDANLGQWQTPYADIWLGEGTTGPKEGSPRDDPAALSQWSARIIFKVPTTPATNGQGWNFVQLRNNNTALGYNPGTWRAGGFSFWGLFGASLVSNQNQISGATSGASFYRLELQADNAETNRLAMRLYVDDGTTPLGTQVAFITSAQLADISIDCIRLGDTNATSPGGTSTFDYGEIEVWNTRNADGEMSNQWDALTTPVIGVFNESASNVGYPRSATYSIPANYTTPSDSTSPPVPLVEGSTQFTNVAYGNTVGLVGGNPQTGMNFDLFLPAASGAPAEGWPLILWFHGGYGVAGDKAGLGDGLNDNFRNRVLNEGWAIASANYVRGTVSNTISAWGTNDSRGPGFGSLQSMICNAKLAAIRMKQKGIGTSAPESITGDGTYPINVNKIVLMGGSFGGYLALAAALSWGLTSLGAAGTDVTLAGNPTFSTLPGVEGAYGGADPVVQGVLGVVPPANVRFARDTDLTEAVTGTVLWPTYLDGTTTETIAGFSDASTKAVMRVANNGTAPTNTELDRYGIPNIASLNSSILPNIRAAIMSGTADRLVVASHKTALDAALSTAAGYASFTSPANHDNGMAVMDWTTDIQPWLDATFNPAAPPSGSGKFPTIPSLPTIPTIPAAA